MGEEGSAGEGFEGWYRREHPRLVASLAVSLGDLPLAQEAADEAFVRALERWEQVADMKAPVAWTYTVAINVGIRVRRRAQVERMLLGRRRERTIEIPAASAEVWHALLSLPPRQRTAIALFYLLDLPTPEVARIMRIAPGTVAATLHSARHRLAQLLGEDAILTEANYLD
ncbi:MAG: sigma-70 family RNA polymerase sigma factor [Actinomycetota bacterium]|nr:sigma-70 family RNA polymerase sigma factor [Actinomycetota bacterium]MDQ6949130.1 sigma-70 family RNA polymerase sigma factor [Actinomycetota bacterium]